MPRIAVLGAHTALAQALLECLEERELGLEISRYTSQEHLAPGLDPYGPAILDTAELLVLTEGGPLAQGFADRARAGKKLLLDLSGALDPAGVKRVWPILDPSAGRSFDPSFTAAIATGLAGPLTAVLKTLDAFELLSVRIATYESAATADRVGMDALSDEVRSVFTLKDVERDHFGKRLAFSAIPHAEADRGSAFDADERMIEAITDGLGPGAPELWLTRVLIPAFSAEGAVVEASVAGAPEEAAVIEALRTAKGLRYVAGEPSGAADALERDDALVSRVRVKPGRIGLWLAADRLRVGSATAATLFIEQWLDRRGA